MSCASSTCVLFISLMQLVNRTQFLSITFLLMLYTGAAGAAVFETAIIPLMCMYASLESLKFDVIIKPNLFQPKFLLLTITCIKCFLQFYYMKGVLGDSQKEMLN